MLDTATTTLLTVQNVNQTYATGSGELQKLVLDNVSMSFKSGEIVALLGRSGSGKSTLLRIIAGLNRPSSGSVTIAGKPVTGPAEEVSMVFQSFALFPWLNVLDNVEIGPRANGVSLEETSPAGSEGDRHDRPGRLRIPPIPRSFPAACASASASPAPWSCSRRSC